MSAKKSGKKIVAVVSAMGALLAIVVDLVGYLREMKADIGECIYRLAQPEGKETLKSIAELIADGWRQAKTIATMSLSELIDQGNYDYINSDINEKNFPIDKSFNPNEETRFFHFNREITFEEVKAEMDKEGWKPATIWHLLILVIKNPESQKKFPIIALGSVWRGLVPYLLWYGIDCERNLYLNRFDDFWRDDCRFLAVRK